MVVRLSGPIAEGGRHCTPAHQWLDLFQSHFPRLCGDQQALHIEQRPAVLVSCALGIGRPADKRASHVFPHVILGAAGGSGLGDDAKRANPLDEAVRAEPQERAQKRLSELSDHWAQQGLEASEVPLAPKNPEKPSRDWLPEPEWISGADAFDMLRLQTEPCEFAPPITRLCQVISDQFDHKPARLNYALASLPPSHDLLKEFVVGSVQWFRALHSLLTLQDAEKIDGLEGLVDNLYEWIVMFDCLRIRTRNVLEDALSHHWSVRELSLPEAKQEPIWSFPRAMAWIATRDYLALARMPVFAQPGNGPDDAVAVEGVWKYATMALGWLHTEIAYKHCKCGAFRDFGLMAFKHCTCISVAWEDLVRFRGGLSQDTPELVFNLQEGWLSMTWPDGADEVRFLRRDILDHWPALPTDQQEALTFGHSTTTGEQKCREWLAEQFADDPDRRRSKKDFREAALTAFPGRLSERGFNLRVWPDLARDHGRDGAGAKRKS